jgi:hypothetical protein
MCSINKIMFRRWSRNEKAASTASAAIATAELRLDVYFEHYFCLQTDVVIETEKKDKQTNNVFRGDETR